MHAVGMKLNLQTDYALRALIFLGSRTDRLSSIREIAETYRISENHMVKVIHRLGKGGFIETLRGRNGGIRLGRLAETIRIGAVVSYMEEDMSLLDCLSHKTCERESTCILMPSCRLRGVLSETMQAMMSVLDRYTLADMITPFECERLIRNETKD